MPSDDFTEKIDLLVNDENRIVTYKILSHELKIHVNKAKQCLAEYFNEQKTKGIDLAAHYFLAGFVENDGIRSVKIAVVSEDTLDIAKKSYVELTSFHIYAVCKGASKDECALYSSDFTYTKDKDEQTKYAAIKHPNIETQPPVLNKMPISNDVKLNIGKKETPVQINGNLNSDSKKEAKAKESPFSPEKNENSVENKSKDSKASKTTPEDGKHKGGTLMSMWQKKEEKQNGLKKETVKADVKGKQAAKSVPKNNLLTMFSKQAIKNAEKPPEQKPVISKDEESPKVTESPKATLSTVVPKKEDTKKSVNENKKSSLKRKASNKISKSSESKLDSDSENEFRPKSKKKHRRICTFDDSDSESEAEEEKDKAQRSFFLPEEPMDTVVAKPISDDEEPIPPTPPVVRVKGKAKVWKTVQKTYEDEEGFFVTKNEKELVSASEDEEDPVKIQQEKKEIVMNKKANSVNKKQASLMSFFKQK